MPLVSCMFNLEPEPFSVISIISKALRTEYSLSNRVASSAYWLIFTWSFEPGRKTPSMSGFWRIRFARVSTTKIYKSGDKGQPCREPIVSLIGFEACPLFVTMQFTSMYSQRKPSLKFIFCITLSKNCQLRRLKAFPGPD